MKTKSKTVRDAEKVTKEFFAAVEARRDFYKADNAFMVGYLEGFLKMNADQKLLETMESRTATLRTLCKDAA